MAPQLFFTSMAYRSTSFRRSLARKTMVPHNWQCPYLPIYVVASNMHKTKQRAPLDQRVLHNNIFTRVSNINTALLEIIDLLTVYIGQTFDGKNLEE